jgi:YfiH family protein
VINQTDRMITSEVLSADAGIHHAFFTRRGGVSEGLFGSLNCGFGSGDASPKVAHNRGIAMACLGLAGDRLATLRQVHSAEVVIVEQPWCREDAPMADGLVSGVPGIALGVLAADCAPILLHDPVARVIGAAHGGWRGALGGIVDGTIARMAELGAERPRIRAAVGPCIGRRSYEVGPEFPQHFVTDDPGNLRFFAPAPASRRFLFDLAGYIAHRLRRAGITTVDVIPHDTVEEEERFFSYRRACLRGERAYGRGLSAIALEE